MDLLRDFILTIVKIESKDLDIILSKFKERTVNKGQFILRKGQVAHQYYFIKSGGLRFFFGDFYEQTTAWVIFKNEFFTEICSLNPQVPTRFNIEAIEDTELIYIEKEDMDLLYTQFPLLQEFGRKIWESMSVRMVDIILDYQILSAEQRYLNFMKTPELVQKISVKDLASYLGITPNALSRIRKNIK